MAVQQVRMLREADLTEIQKFTLFASCAFDARSMALVRVLVMRSFPEAATSHSALDAQDEGVDQTTCPARCWKTLSLRSRGLSPPLPFPFSLRVLTRVLPSPPPSLRSLSPSLVVALVPLSLFLSIYCEPITHMNHDSTR